MANSSFMLFEISWEVCNKVGGIHTVLSTKAKEAVARYGDSYVAVGPWLLGEQDDTPFEPEAGHEDFVEACRAMGFPVRMGRWNTPGRPRVLLIEFSRSYDHKDDILARLWEDYGVDSISGDWDYIEPVLFGHAAGRVIERYCQDYLVPAHRRAIVHAHEWMTASSLLYLKSKVASVGTVFTTHATMLGRALSSLGHSPSDGLGGRTAKELAEENNVVAKHSLEGVAAREADVFTTVSQITADEAALLHERRPDPLLPNGIDLDVIDALIGDAPRATVRGELFDLAARFLGEPADDAVLLCVSGRYEFHNKGIDLLLESLAKLAERSGPPVVLWILVPAGNSGPCSELLARRDPEGSGEFDGPVGLSTHNLFDAETDPVHELCGKLGLDNALGSRVKVIQVPIYLRPNDGFLNRSYEAVLRAMDLSCFPSYYEPWGYTPQESIAVGVPTITSDYAGFGRWAAEFELSDQDGVMVLPRVHRQYDEVVDDLASLLERKLQERPEQAEACRRTAARTAWSDLMGNYERAYEAAFGAIEARGRAGVPHGRSPRRPLTSRPAKHSAAPHLLTFDVAATLPAELEGLLRLARNFWWCWDAEATDLFASLSPRGWEASGHNPTQFLQRVFAQDLEAKAADPEYRARLHRVLERFDAYLSTRARSFALEDGLPPLSSERPVAYFSAEFGIHESLPIYSGGLGVLAGDHLKSASDLDLPLVGVGLFYSHGYMAQRLSADGDQIAIDVLNDPSNLAIESVRDVDDSPLELRVPLPGRELSLRIWRAQIGRVPLYLLDANTPSNSPEDREITRNLYGGDSETRILQEIVLGRGGVRLLRKLGLAPSAWHLNEGHAAFSTVERVARLVRDEGLTFEEAREFVRRTTAFTTHTPVPAGHDRFGEDLVRRYFSDAESWVGLPWDRFWELGRASGEADRDDFNMTYLALHFAGWVNGVSAMHGDVSRQLLRSYWPGLLVDEVPIDSVTNGIHLPTWTAGPIADLLGAHERTVTGEDFASQARGLTAAAVWSARRSLKTTLGERIRASLERTFVERSDSPKVLSSMIEGLDEDALWIGFARRFAPYKRAHLLFQDVERLRSILDASDRPVRILVAGKAHPRDGRGQEILKEIAAWTRSPELLGRVFVLENYDMSLARALVQGVDIWLNNPTRGQEASGTSGMKASANGGLNLSIADGWWPEAADGANGWTIAGDRLYAQQDLQDQFDANALYRLLEDEIVPLYFERDPDGVPPGWMERVLHALATVPVQFQTDRMVLEYFEKAYRPLASAALRNEVVRKRDVKLDVRDANRVRRGFSAVRIVSTQVADARGLRVGDAIGARVDVELGELRPDDVTVELVLGHARGGSDLEDPESVMLEPTSGSEAGGVTTFEGKHALTRSGSYAHGLRVRARVDPNELILWA